jgi:hypothetical protein
MGHIRLGKLPRTRAWDDVVALIAGGASAAKVAVATIRAAETGLRRAANDKGVVESVWLLIRLPHAAREATFAEGLRSCDVEVAGEPCLMEVVGAVADALDARLPNNRGRTDLGEMAQAAAGEAVVRIVSPRAANMFGTTPADVRSAFAGLATVRQFGVFARFFFARFVFKCLSYFLSRTLADHVGEGRRFTCLRQQGEFQSALDLHCREAAAIVERFSGEWVAKTRYESGPVTREDAARFVAGSVKKLLAELRAGVNASGD